MMARASPPPTTLRMVAGPRGAPPSLADVRPVIARATSTATTVTGTRNVCDGNRIAIKGSSAPIVNASAEDSAACHGLVRLSGSMPRLPPLREP